MSMFPAQGTKRGGEKERWLDVATREHGTTLRVLEGFPADKIDLKPSPKSMSARDLAFLFVMEQGLLATALTTGFDWSKAPSFPKAPESLAEIVAALKAAHERVLGLVRDMPDDELRSRTAQFFTAPKQLGDVPLMDFMWMIVHDQIHHRGQLTVYSRIAGGRVPSVYGPSADEPWS